MWEYAMAKKKHDFDQVCKKYKEHLIGGKSSGKNPDDFDKKQLKKGWLVELDEHTTDPYIALEIAMDHLTEFDKYYDSLDEMETKLKKTQSSFGGKPMRSLGALVLAALKVVVANLPKADYPPANIKTMIDTCKAKGRDDLADQIIAQWSKVLEKYPDTRVNWGAAATIGNHSIKKHVFGGKAFVDWLTASLSTELTPKEETKLEGVDKPVLPEDTPAIAIPTKTETPEDWSNEAAKTTSMRKEAKASFRTAEEFIDYMNTQVEQLSRKLAEYGPGGSKATTKGGKPTAMSERVPKWEAQLKAYKEELVLVKDKLEEGSANLVKAETRYENTRITTVKYEEKTQEALSEVLEFILELKDLKKKKELLVKFKQSMKEMEAQDKAVAALGEDILSIWSGIKIFFKRITNISNKAVKATEKLNTWLEKV